MCKYQTVMTVCKRYICCPFKRPCILTDFFVSQVPVFVSALLAVIFLYLFIAPFIGGNFKNYIFPLAFLIAGVVFYIPFVFFKLRIPGIGQYDFRVYCIDCKSTFGLTGRYLITLCDEDPKYIKQWHQFN